MNNIQSPTIHCPNCGAVPTTYDNCEFCGSSLEGVVSKELLATKRRQRLASEIEERNKAEKEYQSQQTKAKQQKREKSHRKLMKMLPFIALAVVVVVGGGILYNSMVRLPNIENAAWERAVQSHTIEELQAFLEAHPRSEHADAARAQLNPLREKIEREIAESSVLIAGVRWATSNVDAPGTFAATPESTGMLYQWNRLNEWSANGYVTEWNRTEASGRSWGRVNDPCPQGWRVPTSNELNSLINVGSMWTTKNGVNGRLFGVAPNQIFLPAVGDRSSIDGSLSNVGSRGGYWSSTPSGNAVRRLRFNSTGATMETNHRAFGFSVRCVAAN